MSPNTFVDPNFTAEKEALIGSRASERCFDLTFFVSKAIFQFFFPVVRLSNEVFCLVFCVCFVWFKTLSTQNLQVIQFLAISLSQSEGQIVLFVARCSDSVLSKSEPVTCALPSATPSY